MCSERSETFRTEYAAAEEYLSTKEQYGCPTCVSLGPNGYYFIRTAWGCSYKIPDDAKAHLGDMTKIEHFFFGANGAWVALKYGGARSWDLKGLYPGLDTRIRDGLQSATDIRVSTTTAVFFVADDADMPDSRHESRVWRPVGHIVEERPCGV